MTDSKQTLEQVMASICAANDLSSIAITHHPNLAHQGPHYGANAHWDGYSRRSYTCASGEGKDIATALADCLANAKADRTPPEQEITALPSFEVQP